LGNWAPVSRPQLHPNSTMHTHSQARAAAQDEADPALPSPHMGADVLMNGLLFAQMWQHLDADDKKQMRAVGRGVRALADALVVALDMHGKSKSDLASALALFPNVQRLAADCDAASAAVISAAPLAKLKALVLSQTVSHACAWGARHAGGNRDACTRVADSDIWHVFHAARHAHLARHAMS
jgi:hypothetical protein